MQMKKKQKNLYQTKTGLLILIINKKFSTKVEVGKRIKLKVEGKSKIFAKNNKSNMPHIRPGTSRTLYKIIDDLQKESEGNNDKVMKIKYDYNYDRTDRVLKNVLNGNDLWNTELNNYIKKITLDYKKIWENSHFIEIGVYLLLILKI